MENIIDKVNDFLQRILLVPISTLGFLLGIVICGTMSLLNIDDNITIKVAVICFTPFCILLLWILIRSILNLFIK